MVADRSFEYNGLLLGGPEYPVTLVEGLNPPDSREDVIPKGIQHGAHTYAQFLSERRIVLAGYISEDDDASFAARVEAWRAAFVPQSAYRPFRFHLPGEIDKRVHAIPTRRYFPWTVEASRIRYLEWSLELLAGDPLIYSESEKSLVGTGTATNDGIIGTAPVVDITGASNNPSIENQTVGKTVSLTGVIPGGDIWTIDFAEKTIKDQAGVSHYSALDPNSEWWLIEDGDNDIVVSGGGSFNIRWRDAWI